MKVLIVKLEGDTPLKKNQLEGVVKIVYSDATVVKLERSISMDQDVDDVSEKKILASGGFDLIIHHSGGGNPEYKKFVSAYRRLARASGWVEPVIILFTGGTGIEDTAKLYAKDPMICVASQRDLDANLDRFLMALVPPARRKGKTLNAPCHVFVRTPRSTSHARPALSEWKMIAHDLMSTFEDYPAKRDEARALIGRWENSMRRVAPENKIHLRLLKMLVDLDPVEVDQTRLVSALNKLKVSVGLNPVARIEVPDVDQFPRHPPQNYETVLIANDTPNLPLVQLLKEDYKYHVLTQAPNLKTAKKLLAEKRPQVVIADYWFKSEREGLEFIREAKKAAWKPLVIANSYQDLPDDDLPRGVVNFSGDDAHIPSLIHGVIWNAAGGARRAGDESGAAKGIAEDEATCWKHLETCLSGLEFHFELWRKFLRTDLKYTLRELRRRRSRRRTRRPGGRDIYYFIEELIGVLEPFDKSRSLSYQTVDSLIEVIGILHRQMRGLLATTLVKDVRSLCHEIENRSTKNIRYLLSKLRNTIDCMALFPHLKATVGRIRAELDKCGEDFNLPRAGRLSRALNSALAKHLQPRPSQDQRGVTQLNKRINILVVEDDDDWREKFVLPVVDEVKEKLAASGYHIDRHGVDNKDCALSAAPIIEKTRKIVPQDDAAVTIAIVDLNIPKDKRDAARIRSSRTKSGARSSIPQKKHGEELIKELRSRNIPVIVLTRSASRQDRIKAERLGIANINYILKDYSNKGRLEAAILRNIEKPRAHVIKNYGLDEKHQFRVDGFEIPLTRKENKKFEAICELSTKVDSFTIRDLLDQQKSADREDTEQKYISSIRKKIQDTLNKEGAKATGSEEVIITYQYGEGTAKTRYGLDPAVEYIPYASNDDEGETTRIMLVEDDPIMQSYLYEKFTRELRDVEVERAADLETALSLARGFNPHIMSLDLRLPRRASSREADPHAGLDLFEEVRRFRNGVRAVISTTQHDDPVITDRVASHGLSGADFIPKLGEGWEDILVTRIERHRAELMGGRAAGTTTDFTPPAVEILPGTDLKAGHLSLLVNGVRYTNRLVNGSYIKQEEKVSRIMGLLLREADKTVTWEKIGKWIGEKLSNDTPSNANDKKNWTKRCRKMIKKWLKDPALNINGKNVTELILQRPKTGPGLKLNVRVIGPRPNTKPV
jgi:DNA-binding response OmpR family regulator